MLFHWNFFLLFVFVNGWVFIFWPSYQITWNARKSLIFSEREPLCAYGPDAVDLNRRFVREHNEFRRKHGVPLLYANLDLVETSIDWSLDLAEEDTLKRSKSDGLYGENLYWSSALPDRLNINDIFPVQTWYSQRTQYDGNFRIDTRDFTQMIWASTREIGCGLCSGSGGTYVICRYIPAGNIGGKFKQNVLKRVPPIIPDPKNSSSGTPHTLNPGEDSSILTPLLYGLSIAIVVFALTTVVIFLSMICYYSKRFLHL